MRINDKWSILKDHYGYITVENSYSEKYDTWREKGRSYHTTLDRAAFYILDEEPENRDLKKVIRTLQKIKREILAAIKKEEPLFKPKFQ